MTGAQEPVQPDWTIDPGTGRSNSPERFQYLAAEVGHLIRSGGSAQCLSPRWTAATARTIVAQLAHVHGLAPSGSGHSQQEPAPAATDYRAQRRQQKPAGRCPNCGGWIYLDETGRIGFHPVMRQTATQDPGMETCEGSGREPARTVGQPEPTAPPACPGCGMPETNCCCG